MSGEVVGVIENVLPKEGDYMIEPPIVLGGEIYSGYVVTNSEGSHAFVETEEARSWGRRNGCCGGEILPDAFANVVVKVAERKFANGEILRT